MDFWATYLTIGSTVGLFLVCMTQWLMNQNPHEPQLPIQPGAFGFAMFLCIFLWPFVLLLMISDLNDMR